MFDPGGWLGAEGMNAWIAPADTFDGAEQTNRRSLGIVDDTCELRITVTLDRRVIGMPPIRAHANVFSGPPDFAPDRRPFVSLADELNDRAAPAEIASRNANLDAEARDRWVEDLFERAFETISLLNVDAWRNARASQLNGAALRPQSIAGDQVPEPERALGGRDALRDGNISLQAPSEHVPLPLYARASQRHRLLADIEALKAFVRADPARLTALLRPPYKVASNENGFASTMQMPPFMRAGDAQPLTVAPWQFELLMAWQSAVTAGPALELLASRDEDMARRAAERRATVLTRLDNS